MENSAGSGWEIERAMADNGPLFFSYRVLIVLLRTFTRAIEIDIDVVVTYPE